MNSRIFISPIQIGHDKIIVPNGQESPCQPWQREPPPILFKYFPSERLHVLKEEKVRFSQREVFDDQRDLRPAVARFGSAGEIRKFMEIDPVLKRHSAELKEAVINHVLNTPGREAALIEQTQKFMTAPEEFGVFCLCENGTSEEMWQRYADNGTGFVVAFDTKHSKFDGLRSPGLLGKVEYSDTLIPSFLGAYGASAFFQKRAQYAFEVEWRSVRALTRFKDVSRTLGCPAIYLAPFDPACLREIRVRSGCKIYKELQSFLAETASYKHVKFVEAPA